MGGKKNQGGTFEFASSNAMWRASLDLLDFTPLSNVDYSGGIIITDWFADENSSIDESLKLTVKFLSNEIRADGINVVIHKKTCGEKNKCIIKKNRLNSCRGNQASNIKRGCNIKLTRRKYG